MRFIIKPSENSFRLILEASQYRIIWKTHARRVLKAFRDVTALDFQQSVITARVSSVGRSSAGFAHHPMVLTEQGYLSNRKLLIMIHELSHRLLGGHALNEVEIGPDVQGGDSEDVRQEVLHRTIYLFLYDVVELALGKEWAAACEEFEAWDPKSPHGKAWAWAMVMTRSERQAYLKSIIHKRLDNSR